MAKKRPAGERPVWAPTPVDVDVDAIHPLIGWVLLKECFLNMEHRVQGPGGEVILSIARPYVRNTIFADVLAIHPETAEEISVEIGDRIILHEFSGGRWAFKGVNTLMTPSQDILAVVTSR